MADNPNILDRAVATAGGAALNELTNGGHEIWQRGAGAFTANNAYAADRKQISLAGTDTLSVSRDGTNKAGNSLYASACVFVLGSGAGATAYREVLKIADGYHHLLGGPVSFRAWVKLAAGVASAVRAYIKTDGTGGATTYSSYHGNNTAAESLDALLAVVPADATYVEVGLAFAASATVYTDNWMLVATAFATDYVGRHPGDELTRCQRYYEIIDAGFDFDGHSSANGNAYRRGTTYATTKGGVPTLTKNGTWTAGTCGQPAVTNSRVNGFAAYVVATNSGPFNSYTDSADDNVTAEYNP